MKKTFTLFALSALAFVATTSMNTKKMLPNIPMYHETLGELDVPINVTPVSNPNIWTIQNLTACNMTLWLYFSIEENETIRALPRSLAGYGTASVDANAIRGLFGLGAGGFNLTNISAVLTIGSGYSLEIYPKPAGWFTVSTGLPYPCDCIKINFDETTQTIIITEDWNC